MLNVASAWCDVTDVPTVLSPLRVRWCRPLAPLRTNETDLDLETGREGESTMSVSGTGGRSGGSGGVATSTAVLTQRRVESSKAAATHAPTSTCIVACDLEPER